MRLRKRRVNYGRSGGPELSRLCCIRRLLRTAFNIQQLHLTNSSVLIVVKDNDSGSWDYGGMGQLVDLVDKGKPISVPKTKRRKHIQKDCCKTLGNRQPLLQAQKTCSGGKVVGAVVIPAAEIKQEWMEHCDEREIPVSEQSDGDMHDISFYLSVSSSAPLPSESFPAAKEQNPSCHEQTVMYAGHESDSESVAAAGFDSDWAALSTEDQAALSTEDQAALSTEDQAALSTEDQAMAEADGPESHVLNMSEVGTSDLHASSHVPSAEQPYPHQCTACDKTYASKKSLNIHMRTHKLKKKSVCPECGKMFTNDSRLSEHRKCHDSGDLLSCPECGKGFFRAANLEVHRRIHTGHRLYSCHHCDKCFIRENDLNNHIRACSQREKNVADADIKPVVTGDVICESCGKSFNRKESLKVHCRRVHSAVRPFMCDTCGKGFAEKRDMEDHMRRHTGELYICPQAGCGKRYRSRLGMNRHRNHHEGASFPCNFCGKDFSVVHTLQRHIQAQHTDSRYVCECGKKYKYATDIQRHKELSCVHEVNARPTVRHQCNHCNKTFKSIRYLAEHLKREEKKQPIVCELCGKEVPHKGVLIKHRKKVHNIGSHNP